MRRMTKVALGATALAVGVSGISLVCGNRTTKSAMATDGTDKLTATVLGLGNYGNFSYTSTGTGAVYVGNGAKGTNSSIQLRSKKIAILDCFVQHLQEH